MSITALHSHHSLPSPADFNVWLSSPLWSLPFSRDVSAFLSYPLNSLPSQFCVLLICGKAFPPCQLTWPRPRPHLENVNLIAHHLTRNSELPTVLNSEVLQAPALFCQLPHVSPSFPVECGLQCCGVSEHALPTLINCHLTPALAHEWRCWFHWVQANILLLSLLKQIYLWIVLLKILQLFPFLRD